MLNFKSYNELSDLLEILTMDISDFNSKETDKILTEKVGNNWMKAISSATIAKIMSLTAKIKTEKDLDKKMNLLADLIRHSSYLSNLSVAVAAMDKSIVKIRK